MVPKTISHYRILERLGEGGMGEVYLAEDTTLNRKVAIKFLSPKSIGSGVARKRLLREAQAAASLDHPNICAVYEVGEIDGDCFIVMQYLEGETLHRRLSGKKLDQSEALRLVLQMADGLAEAHSRGIVHRDVKPQNLFITNRGQVRVLDFGLAKVIFSEQQAESKANTLTILSNPGAMIGTMPYMSPEQVRAENVDSRSDIFSLGTVLYEMLTGRQPFVASNQAVTLSAILTQSPPPLSRYMSNPPIELERIVRKCLEKDRDQRYQSAKDLIVDLRSLQRHTSANFETIEDAPAHWSPKASWARLAGIAALVVLISLGVYFFARRGRAIDSNRQITSVAVIPFVETSGDPEMDYLSDGITDGLINSLSQLPNVKIIGHASVFRYKGKDIDARTVGSELGVDSVLTGRIVQHGKNIGISVELVDSQDNHHLWGAQYNRQVSDILAMQDDMTQVITERLRLKLSGEDQKRLSKHYTENSEAYQLYLKGRYFWNKRTEADLEKAVEYFQQAINTDPNYALAYAGLADAYATLGSAGFDAMLPDEAMPKARLAATKALEIDNALAEAHTSLAYVKFVYDWDWATADNEFKRAIELNGNYPAAHLLRSHYLMAMGRSDESILESRRALELDPLSITYNTNVGRALVFARQNDRALEQLRKTLELDPKYIWAHYLLGIVYEQTQMYDQALSELEEVKTLSGDSAVSEAALAHVYAVAHKKNEALKIAENLKVRGKTQRVPPYYLAIIYAGLDDSTQALEWLEKAYHERTNQMAYLRVEPAFDKLREDSRFQNMIHRLGL